MFRSSHNESGSRGHHGIFETHATLDLISWEQNWKAVPIQWLIGKAPLGKNSALSVTLPSASRKESVR
jgi:hypothetical protein